MWYLVDRAGKRCYLTLNKTIKFGRKVGHVLLRKDPSISRLHACISMTSTGGNEPMSTCVLKDLDSKYGTWVQNGEERIKVTRDGYILKDQDEIQLGVLEQTYKVVYVPIIVVTSALDGKLKSQLQSIVTVIGGSISDEWTKKCTHMTVSKAGITEKVTCAMASAVPIVTMTYWERVQEAVDIGAPLPDVKEFTASIDEVLIGKGRASLHPNKKRKTLFQNLLFVHFSLDQYRMYGKIIKLAGGKSVLYETGCLTTEELCMPNTIVLQYPDSSMSQSTLGITNSYDFVPQILEKHGRRMLAETDIPLAIWHCSIEKYCNPTFNFARFLRRKQSCLPAAQVLVPDTQDVASDTRSLPKIVSNVLVTSNISLKNAITRVPIIPDTCDESPTQDISRVHCVNDSEARAEINEPRIIKETADTFADTSLTQETKQVPEESSTRENVCIPETNDSSLSNETKGNADSFKQDIENSPKQDIVMKEMPVINIDPSVNDDSDTDVVICDTDTEENDNNLRRVIPEKEKKETPVKLNTKIVKERYGNCSPIPRGTKVSHKRTSRTAGSASGNDSDEGCIPFAKKDISLENSGTAMEDHKTTDNSERGTSFLRSNSKPKKFTKVYKKIPRTRIALDDMYVWISYSAKECQDICNDN